MACSDGAFVFLGKPVETQKIRTLRNGFKRGGVADFTFKFFFRFAAGDNEHSRAEILKVFESQKRVLDVAGTLNFEKAVWHLTLVEPDDVNCSTALHDIGVRKVRHGLHRPQRFKWPVDK